MLVAKDPSDCTYDQPSQRKRSVRPQYIEALETRLQRAETLLKSLLPNVDLNDPNIDTVSAKDSRAAQGDQCANASDESDHEASLRSMIESTGQLDLDESGHWDFHGRSSGAVFVRRMREQFGGLLGDDDHSAPSLPQGPGTNISSFDSPRSVVESPTESGLPNTVGLPSRDAAKALCEASLDGACAVLRFVHQPSFYAMVDAVYDKPPEKFGSAENRFLPLLYMVLALGCVFQGAPDQNPKEDAESPYMTGIDQG